MRSKVTQQKEEDNKKPFKNLWIKKARKSKKNLHLQKSLKFIRKNHNNSL